MKMSRNPLFSVIVCSIDPLKFTQVNLCYKRVFSNFPHEIIGIHDARSLAEGYNRGLRRARGDIVIFSHDDILILDSDFGQKISHRMQNFDILGFAGTRLVIAESWWCAGFPWLFGAIAHIFGKTLSLNVWNPELWPVADDIQGLDGLCIMARREVAEEIGFDESTFDGFHLYDLDFSFSAWRAGKKLGVCCDIPVIHASMGGYGKEHAHYGRLFIEKHKDALPANSTKIDRITGMAANLSDYRALRTIWREDAFRRSWIAFQRRKLSASTPESPPAEAR